MEENKDALNEKKWAYINLHKDFVFEREGKNGNKFYNCVVPSSVEFDGKNIGGYTFNAQFCDFPVKNWSTKEVDTESNYRTLSVLNKDIKLRKSAYDENTNEWKEIDNLEIKPQELQKALRDSYKEYKKAQENQEIEKIPKKEKTR